MGLEIIKETRKAVKHFGKKTIPGYMRACNNLVNKLITFIEQTKKAFTNTADKINADLTAYNEKANLAIRALEAETTASTTTPEKAI